MNRPSSPLAPSRPLVLIEALEPRIAPAGLLNESKFTSVAVGGSLLLDTSGAIGTFQGLTTGSGGGSGSYLLYLTAGRALVFTTDINGNGRLDPGEVTGIALGKDAQGRDPSLLLFSDVNGDIVTNLQGTSGATLTDSDRNPVNGRDGQLLSTGVNIANITLRTLTPADIDSSLPGNTVANRLALTSFSIHGNVVAAGDINSILIDTAGTGRLTAKFNGGAGDQLFQGATPQIGGLYTGTAANNLDYHFTQNNPFSTQVEGTLRGFNAPAGAHGGDISKVQAANQSTVFSIGTIATGDGGTGARGGNLNDITLHGVTGGYQLIAGRGGDGATGGQGGSIVNFNDLSSVTSEVILHTGDGGTGLLGVGGVGGIATFGTTQIAAGVQVLMGRGGDGFTNGGAGASFTAGTFTTPETATPVGGKFYGTWHDIGDVGNTRPVGTNANGTSVYSPEVLNFNATGNFATAADAAAHGDNFGDGVYTTSAPDQVIVVFGNGFGSLLDNAGNFNGTASATVTLKVPGVINPVVTFGDFNGDGRVDIAVASGDVRNFSGIYVFFNQIGTALDPINAMNYTRSLVGDHPFSAPHQTALPTLADLGFYQTSGAVVNLAAGDYNGDGVTDIAYIQNVVAQATFNNFHLLGVLLGDVRRDPTTGAQLTDNNTGRFVGSGYFYANTASPRAAAQLLNVVEPVGTNTLLASALSTGNTIDPTTHLPAAADTIFYTRQGERLFETYTLAITNLNTHTASALVPAGLGGAGYGQVDTNRRLGANNVSLTDFNVQQIVVQDADGDGFADLVALSKTPANFFVDFTGDGLGGFTIQSGAGDNAGVFLGNGITSIALTSSDTNTDPNFVGLFNTFAVLTLPSNPGPFIREVLLRDDTGAPSFHFNDGGPLFGNLYALGIPVQDQTVLALDGFYTNAPVFGTLKTPADPASYHPVTGYGALAPESTAYQFADLFLFADTGLGLASLTTIRYETANGYYVRGGDGGNAVTGIGGNAGVIGATTAGIGGGTGAITVTFPVAPSYAGQAFLQGGGGGNGFGGGGRGGDITGIAVRYAAGAGGLTSDVELAAGNGGNGSAGDGGRGGNLSQISVSTGRVFTAGNGGNGLHGGLGGSVLGNQSGVFDTFTDTVNIRGGSGGQGALGGGNAGSISNWDSQFANFVGNAQGLGSNFGLIYTTLAGGSAAGGSGGNGGSIINSSPDSTQNNLSGVLTLQTGAGGSGLTGGNGGAISTFNNLSTNQSAVPSTLTVTTGNGGVGVNGAGGTGGAITNFTANATGLVFIPGSDLVGVGRVIAGDGGTSFGAAGGIGGSITRVTATTTSTPLVVAAGAGGDGLTVGGAGGAVTNAVVNSAAVQIGKMLVVAGKGGDAFSAQSQDIVLQDDPNIGDLAHAILAFGGVRGTGGDGGSIANLTQPVGAQTGVDLIAGNGGSTPNASTSLTTNSGVGRGGSVTNVTLTGTVGSVSRDVTLGATTNPPIQAYSVTDTLSGQTSLLSISAVVNMLSTQNGYFSLLGDNTATTNVPVNNLTTFLVTGNVGIVAGAAGTVRPLNGVAQPAQNGVNGDVTGITAQSILSIVAGSVNAVSPVRILSGLNLTSRDGVLGADRSANAPFGPNGQLDYYDPTLGRVVTNLRPGDSLIDGALYASTITQSAGGTQIRGPRVFPVAT